MVGKIEKEGGELFNTFLPDQEDRFLKSKHERRITQMSLSIKTREAVISTLTKMEQDNPTPLERGILLKDCIHKRLVWEPYNGELTKDFIYRVCENGTVERLPLIDFKGYDLKLTYKKTKE